MLKKSPYDVIKSRYVTEKASVLNKLQTNESNPSVKRCNQPKYLFVVDKRANKQEIAQAVEEIYAGRQVKVVAVNTINTKPKARRVRGRAGVKMGIKKAIVTLQAGDTIEDNV